jgi:hypothetical protein
MKVETESVVSNGSPAAEKNNRWDMLLCATAHGLSKHK